MARIAHAGFMHETNTFAPIKASWDDFLRTESFPGLTRGQEVIEVMSSFNIGTAGFLKTAAELGHEPVPIAWASAVPSAHVTEDAFERMSEIVLAGLADLEPYDAVYLDLHGAMVTEHLEDGEGELIRRVRHAIGSEMPLVVSLDLHSNTTETMLDHSDGLIAYRTYPHVDMADTGSRAMRYLDGLLQGARPAKARRALPFLMPLTGQCTMMQPTEGVYEALAAMEGEPGVHSLSFTPGFPPADINDCGPVVVAYGDDQAAADRAADALYDHIMAREAEFQVPFLSPGEAVTKAMASNALKPFVLADVQDNCGAGATSDTTGLLRAMVELQADRTVIGLMVDPEAAAAAHAAGEGAEVDLSLGGKRFTEGGPPFEGRFQVAKLGDGRVTCTGPMFRGAKVNLGPTALLQIGGVGVVVSSNRMQAADQELFRHVGIEPSEQKILGLKSSVHFRADFQPIAEEVLVVGAPGAFIDQPELLPYQNLRPGVRVSPKGRTHGE
ncbi:MAG: M81 family metallopeptidase [Alphaproteobacteria bacterium]|jgi:microcystin degradation protein MlrC|nr:M81 family metallopeptidase [Alphaproteobacteria bacterium]